MCTKYGDCCPDYQDVCAGAFDDLCHRNGKVNSPEEFDDSSSLSKLRVWCTFFNSEYFLITIAKHLFKTSAMS